MPLTAEARPKGSQEDAWEIVDITNYPTPRIELATFDLRCPECKCPMHVRGGLFKIVHFAHNPQRPPLDCAIRRGETVRHLMGKAVIARRLLELRVYRGAIVRKEIWFDSVQRRADLVVYLDEGSFDIHEIQLASITIQELDERTKAYTQVGASEVAWWFGDAADKPENREWALRKCGGYGRITFRDHEFHVDEPITDLGGR